jgi:hypothetical protein
MNLLWWRKKQRTELILDGIKKVQLYICPNCGNKVETVNFCKLCGCWICRKCEKKITFYFDGSYLQMENLYAAGICGSCRTKVLANWTTLVDNLKKTSKDTAK